MQPKVLCIRGTKPQLSKIHHNPRKPETKRTRNRTYHKSHNRRATPEAQKSHDEDPAHTKQKKPSHLQNLRSLCRKPIALLHVSESAKTYARRAADDRKTKYGRHYAKLGAGMADQRTHRDDQIPRKKTRHTIQARQGNQNKTAAGVPFDEILISDLNA